MPKASRTWVAALSSSALGLGVLATAPSTFAASTAPEAVAHQPSAAATTPVLARGDRGKAVARLQADLRRLGYVMTGPVDGIFGPKTAAGVRAFQRAHGLPVTGVVTAAVWAALTRSLADGSTGSAGAAAPADSTATPLLARGDRGRWVATLQADLRRLGYTVTGPVDGIFGPKTAAGVRAFQEHEGLPATGTVDRATWQALVQAVARAPEAQGQSSAGPAAQAGPAAAPTMIAGHRVVAVHHMLATAYGPSLQDNYPYGPTDYFGQPLQPGMVAVDPSVIPLRSLVYVTGYTDPNLPAGGFVGRAMDTGGAIKGNRIDIYMDAGPRAVSNFGIEPVSVYVLAP
ncbi:MAG: peptidoglycan-binding protein [Actinomycetia bacterium]|nr:peptidoglycan-binding protein [Actinomycetes bacterium]